MFVAFHLFCEVKNNLSHFMMYVNYFVKLDD